MLDCIRTTRGSVTESTHPVHIAVVSASGELLYSAGNPHRQTLLRSAAKPAQSVATLEACGSKISFSDADVALMSASHSSEARHISRARSMLASCGAHEEHMRCGGHPALNPGVNRAWIRADFTPGAVENNCSGKHAGMLAGAKSLGAGFADYHTPEHPMQKAVKRVVEQTSGVEPHEIQWAVDGCNLPAPAMPLTGMGAMYARFASSVDNATTERERTMKRVFEAMCAHPGLVGGEKRFCTKLMRAYGGLLIGKVGADGCYGVGIRASEDTRRLGVSEGGVGIAVKIESGSMDLVYAAVTEILAQLQIGNEDVRSALQEWRTPEIFNTMGIVTGATMHCFEIRKET
ncbi:hypothetical protein E8E12_005374 [Didymella heteroderae]|uniref:L-asparaginase II n=1 Tax=Didymella heteroderae TaxID=1769908 RepID=A0A9P5BXR9_9PLEO|nr:hypothetical protein E8E12_005374 [Didymella heteroderae]